MKEFNPKCIWCSEKPIRFKKTMLCKSCQTIYYLHDNKKPRIDNDLCVVCNNKKILIKKWKLCSLCYGRLQTYGGLNMLPTYPLQTLEEKRHKIIKRYGSTIINDFELLKTDPIWTLERMGKKYGFTREYARQLFKIIFDKSYGHYRRKKMKGLGI